MNLAICAISYNRPNSTQRVLDSLKAGIYGSDKVDLIISIDNSGNDAIEDIAKKFTWPYGFKRVITHCKRLGLRNHVIEVGSYTQEYDGLIVLEDDIYVAPSFYLYAKACVTKYADDSSIAGISLYSFKGNYHRNFIPFSPLQSDSDIFLMQNAQSWGQVWMRKQWKEFKDWYDSHSDDFHEMPHLPKSICSWKKSWLKYHTRYCIETNKYFVYPYTSFSTCCNEAGEHVKKTDNHLQVSLFYGEKKEFNLNPIVKYDAFFENEILYKKLKLTSKELCIDIYGEKGNRLNRRYWLTRETKPYKILAKYGLFYRPIENNIRVYIN